MKQVAQNYKSGELAVLDVPAPACAPGGVLVRSLYSLISTGTELMKLGESKMSLDRQGARPPGPVEEGARYRPATRASEHLPQGHEPARLLHASRLFAGRRRGRGGPGSGGVPRRPARRLRRQRVRTSRRAQLGAGQPVRPGARTGWRPTWPPSPPWVRSPSRAFARPKQPGRHGPGHRARPGRPTRRTACWWPPG